MLAYILYAILLFMKNLLLLGPRYGFPQPSLLKGFKNHAPVFQMSDVSDVN